MIGKTFDNIQRQEARERRINGNPVFSSPCLFRARRSSVSLPHGALKRFPSEGPRGGPFEGEKWAGVGWDWRSWKAQTRTRAVHTHKKHMYKYPVIVHIHITCVYVHESVHEDVSEHLITHAIITSSIFKRRKCPSDQRRHKLDGMYTESRPVCLVSQHWGHDSHARTLRLRESWAEVVWFFDR